jgi:hypothetical protein
VADEACFPYVPWPEQADAVASGLRESFDVPGARHRPAIAYPQFLDFPFPGAESGHERHATSPRGISPFLVPRGRTESPPFKPDAEFATICESSAQMFNPREMGFIPRTFWPEREYTFGELVADFFRKKNSSNSRFSHKLYNALKIADERPFYVAFLGVEWISETVIKVDKRVFARLLGINVIDGSLFHQQGNFPSHGFVQISERVARGTLSEADLEGVDDDNVRLLTHQSGIFTRGCREDAIERCKWINTRKRPA